MAIGTHLLLEAYRYLFGHHSLSRAFFILYSKKRSDIFEIYLASDFLAALFLTKFSQLTKIAEALKMDE